jgi:hypothetical protein
MLKLGFHVLYTNMVKLATTLSYQVTLQNGSRTCQTSRLHDRRALKVSDCVRMCWADLGAKANYATFDSAIYFFTISKLISNNSGLRQCCIDPNLKLQNFTFSKGKIRRYLNFILFIVSSKQTSVKFRGWYTCKKTPCSSFTVLLIHSKTPKTLGRI